MTPIFKEKNKRVENLVGKRHQGNVKNNINLLYNINKFSNITMIKKLNYFTYPIF